MTRHSLKFGLLLSVCLLGAAYAAEGDAPRRRGGLTPEVIEKGLTGDLALTAEQKTKVTEAYDKTVKPVREKWQNADADKRREIGAELRTANETFKGQLKTILKDEQYKKLETLQPQRRKEGGETKKEDAK